MNDQETVITDIRTQINRLAVQFKDSGTSDYWTGLTEYHEKIAWMLRSHLK